MKTLPTLTLAALVLSGLGTVSFADVASATALPYDIATDFDGSAADEFDRRGRRKPRVPGGSGCDDPGDIREHPECRG